ncbi:MAG TPA: hypothetical protein VK469_15185 [Candidatus Kapabacteria bacterium]|nr:hypothetical protein [Candidatus Kapabacteria bacterium]
MNLRKSSYFKPLCLLVAALFTCQCFYMERKLISTEEKIIENGSQAYLYELEKVKTPSAQDPMIEYRIVKFPANRVELINTYQKIIKTNLFFFILGGCIIGGFLAKDDYEMSGVFNGLLIGLTLGGTGKIIWNKKSGIIGEIKKPTRSYLQKKPNSTPIPAQNLPLEFKWRTRGKLSIFKTQTDEQGIVRVNLIEDLKMTKFPFDQPLTLFILYFNPESQRKGIFKDSLGPEK